MEYKGNYINIGDGKASHAECVRLQNGNLDIPKIVRLIRNSANMLADDNLISILVEAVGLYPIGNEPIPISEDEHTDAQKILHDQLLMEQMEGPQGG